MPEQPQDEFSGHQGSATLNIIPTTQPGAARILGVILSQECGSVLYEMYPTVTFNICYEISPDVSIHPQNNTLNNVIYC